MFIAAVLGLAFQNPAPENVLVTITVAGDEHYTRPHAIMISPESLGGEVWAAVRTWDGGVQTLTSVDCPAITDAVRTFAELPPVAVESPVLAVAHGGSWPIGPILLHGFETTLSFQTTTDDGSVAKVQLSGGNTYRLWGNRTVAALIACWGPLTPEPVAEPGR